MPYRAGLVKNVFILRWRGVQFADSASLMQRVREARSHATGPLVYLAIVPAGDSPPDLATRRELGRALQELVELCVCVHLVLEGKGFRAAAQRAVATSMFLMTGQRGRVTAHASVSEALACCQNLLAPAAEILAKSATFAAAHEATLGAPH